MVNQKSEFEFTFLNMAGNIPCQKSVIKIISLKIRYPDLKFYSLFTFHHSVPEDKIHHFIEPVSNRVRIYLLRIFIIATVKKLSVFVVDRVTYGKISFLCFPITSIQGEVKEFPNVFPVQDEIVRPFDLKHEIIRIMVDTEIIQGNGFPSAAKTAPDIVSVRFAENVIAA